MVPNAAEPIRTVEPKLEIIGDQLPSTNESTTDDPPADATENPLRNETAAKDSSAELENANEKLAEAKDQIRAMKERVIAGEKSSKSLQAQLNELSAALEAEKKSAAELAAKTTTAAEAARKATRSQQALKNKVAAYEKELAKMKQSMAEREAELAKQGKDQSTDKLSLTQGSSKSEMKPKDAKAPQDQKTKKKSIKSNDKKSNKAKKAEKLDASSSDVRVKKLQDSLVRQLKKAKQIHQRELSKELRQIHEDGGDNVKQKVAAAKEKANKLLEQRVESIQKRVQTRIDRLIDK